MVDNMETRYRQKSLISLGVPEAVKNGSNEIMLGNLNDNIGQSDVTTPNIKLYHYLITPFMEHRHPVLFR